MFKCIICEKKIKSIKGLGEHNQAMHSEEEIRDAYKKRMAAY